MPSSDLKGDVVAVFADHQKTLLRVAVIGIGLLLLLGLFGGLNVVGGVLFLGYALVWLAVLAFVLWLFYRLVTAVERIAAAQERRASARQHGAVAADNGGGSETDDGDPTTETDDDADRV